MSLDLASERVCYVQCNFCNTILAFVQNCDCSMWALCQSAICQHGSFTPNRSHSRCSVEFQKQQTISIDQVHPNKDCGSSSKCNKQFSAFESAEPEAPRVPPIFPPEKRQRVPSAYNKFIKEEIQRIKASNPDISHREAFSTAAKNWAHFPHIHFGLKVDGNKQTKLHQPFADQAAQKSNLYY